VEAEQQVVLKFLRLGEQHPSVQRPEKPLQQQEERLEQREEPVRLLKLVLQHRQVELVPQHLLQHKYNIWQHRFLLLHQL
jgi:hypothetical protein